MSYSSGFVGALCFGVALAACGARSGLPAFDGAVVDSGADGGASAVDGGHDAGPADADAGPAEAEASVDSGGSDADVCASEPCLCPLVLAAGKSVSGTTCDAVNPPGSSCSDTRTRFYRFTVPPHSERPLELSGHLAWGVLCGCPETVCCVEPSGNTGPDGVGTLLANQGSTPLEGVLAVSRSDVTCGQYTITLGP